MNDRYLYKAKRTDNGKWVVGFYFCMEHTDGRHTHHFIIPLGASLEKGTPIEKIQVEVDPFTICQCTGSKDKNSKLIWENDVTYMRCNGLSGYGKVIYENGCFWIDDIKRGRRYPFSNHDVKYRVDGNIFDNPELLEVGE